MIDDPPEEDVFSILVATDTHLGYEVDHPVRGNDSFVTFEEILHIGRENDVDLILLGGDLFHLTKPSAETLHRCMSLLRQYCMGDRPVSFEIVSDQEKNFENTTQKVVNYEDPNYNVSIPVFSIHGNHDDPTGQSNTSALDILSCAGLVNYFGKCVDVTDVPINPLLLRKGKSLLSIYGLGHIVDKRLCRLFEAGKVNFYQPEEQHDDWFNILVIHQNRAARGVKGYIDESALPGMLDLIIWGHEHDCRVEPEFNATKNFHVMQPGSSVATSLAEGESLPKHVAIVKIYKKQFECTPIPLKTVRPFVFRDTNVSEVLMENPKDLKSLTEKIEEGATKLVQEMIKEALAKKTGHPKQPALPLIRLRLFFEDEGDMINIVRFNQKFEGSVANPTDLLLMKKGIADKKVKRDVLAREVLADILNGEQENWDVKIEDYVQKYFNEQEDNGNDLFRLNVLSVTGLNAGLSRMVDLQDNNAIDFIVKLQTEEMKNYLMEKDIDEDNIDEHMREFRLKREGAGDEKTMVETQLKNSNTTKATKNGSSSSVKEFQSNHEDDENDDDDDDNVIEEDNEAEEIVGNSRGRGRGRATTRKGSRGGGTRAPSAARTPRAARGSRATTTSAAGTGTRGRGKVTAQQTLQQSFANSSQISVVRTSGRSTANRSRMAFLDDDDDD